MKCCICGDEGERHHIKHRGAGGGDEETNILLLCRLHHQQWHAIGPIKFITKYTIVEEILIQKGWKIVEEFGLKKLRRTNEGFKNGIDC